MNYVVYLYRYFDHILNSASGLTLVYLVLLQAHDRVMIGNKDYSNGNKDNSKI